MYTHGICSEVFGTVVLSDAEAKGGVFFHLQSLILRNGRYKSRGFDDVEVDLIQLDHLGSLSHG